MYRYCIFIFLFTTLTSCNGFKKVDIKPYELLNSSSIHLIEEYKGNFLSRGNLPFYEPIMDNGRLTVANAKLVYLLQDASYKFGYSRESFQNPYIILFGIYDMNNKTDVDLMKFERYYYKNNDYEGEFHLVKKGGDFSSMILLEKINQIMTNGIGKRTALVYIHDTSGCGDYLNELILNYRMHYKKMTYRMAKELEAKECRNYLYEIDVSN